MILELNGLEVSCIIGDRPEERARPQKVTVDARLAIGDEAGATDNLADTVDYALLAERIREALSAARCRLVERAAAIVHGICTGDPHVRSAEVRVSKAGAVEGLACASAVCGSLGG